MAEDIAVKVAEIEQRSKSNTHRLDKVEERQDNLDKLCPPWRCWRHGRRRWRPT